MHLHIIRFQLNLQTQAKKLLGLRKFSCFSASWAYFQVHYSWVLESIILFLKIVDAMQNQLMTAVSERNLLKNGWSKYEMLICHYKEISF